MAQQVWTRAYKFTFPSIGYSAVYTYEQDALAKLLGGKTFYCHIHQIGAVKCVVLQVSRSSMAALEQITIKCLAQGHTGRFFTL
jgi:hypothetical protein